MTFAVVGRAPSGFAVQGGAGAAPTVTTQPTNQSASAGGTSTYNYAGTDTTSVQAQKLIGGAGVATVEGFTNTFGFLNSVTLVTATKPSGTVASDLLLAFFSPTESASGLVVPTGWNEFANVHTNFADLGSRVAWAAGDVAGMGFRTVSGDNDCNITVYRVSGVDLTNPIRQVVPWTSDPIAADSAKLWPGDNTANDMPAPGVTVVAGDAVIAQIHHPQSTTGGSAPSGYTLSVSITNTPHSIIGAYRSNVPAGATGDLSFGVTGGYQSRDAITVALRAASATWTDQTGATTTSYTTPTLVIGDNGAQFRFRLDGPGGSVFTNTVTQTVTSGATIFNDSITESSGLVAAQGGSAIQITSEASSMAAFDQQTASRVTLGIEDSSIFSSDSYTAGLITAASETSTLVATDSTSSTSIQVATESSSLVSSSLELLDIFFSGTILENTTVSEQYTDTHLILPVFTVQPVDRSVEVGNTATFNATVTGPDLSYQWQEIEA
jgi:hypothetical protein